MIVNLVIYHFLIPCFDNIPATRCHVDAIKTVGMQTVYENQHLITITQVFIYVFFHIQI